MLFFTAIALLSSLQPSMAHLPLAYEPERFRQVTNNAAGSWAASDRSVEDFSLESPFDIYDSLYKTLFEFEPAIGRNPSSALFVPSRLIDENDVDYYMYDTTNSNVKEAESSGIYPEMYNFVGYVIAPACEECKDFNPTIVLMVPEGTTSINEDITFVDPVGGEPFDIPPGYQYFIQHPASNPEDRPVYNEPFTRNQWFLPVDYPPTCIEDYLGCSDNPNVITALELTPPSPEVGAQFYFAVYNEHENGLFVSESDEGASCRDFAIVVGHTDAFLASDWARVAVMSEFTKSGRSVGDKCSNVVE